MILRNLRKALVPPVEIGTAVTGICNIGSWTDDEGNSHCRAHLAILLCHLTITAIDSKVGAIHTLLQQVGKDDSCIAQQRWHHHSAQRLDSQPACFSS